MNVVNPNASESDAQRRWGSQAHPNLYELKGTEAVERLNCLRSFFTQ